MEVEAIKRIEELATQQQLDLAIYDNPAAILPGDAGVHDLEHLLEAPRRMRATFKTERIKDFCNYIDANKTGEDGAVFVKPDGSGATAVLDYGSPAAPKWGDHRAVLELKKTPAFSALEEICRAPLAQREVTDFIEDWRHIIQPLIEGESEDGGATEVSIGRAVAAIRKIDLKAQAESGHEESDFKQSRTSLEQVEANTGGHRIPGLFRCRCQVYPETDQRDIDLRLSVLTGDRTPKLRFRMIGRDALLQTTAEEVELRLMEMLDDHQIYVGSV